MLTPVLKAISNLAYRFTQRYQPDYPTEFLLPQIRKTITLEEFPFIAARRDNPAWTEAAVSAKIEALGTWEHYFEFSHGLSTTLHGTFNTDSMAFHRYRSKLISETVVELLAAEAGQATALDLACHCGLMTLDVAFRGLKHAVGVEVRERNLRQAEFLRQYYQIENASFEQGDVYALRDGLEADVVLCLGILYHVVRPVDLIEQCFRRARRFAVIDTTCVLHPGSYYKVITGKEPTSPIEGTRSVEFAPTYQAVIDTMREVGFQPVVEVVGQAGRRIDGYSSQTRRCLIGFKEHYGDAVASRLVNPGV